MIVMLVINTMRRLVNVMYIVHLVVSVMVNCLEYVLIVRILIVYYKLIVQHVWLVTSYLTILRNHVCLYV
jgi:hypothetical protein